MSATLPSTDREQIAALKAECAQQKQRIDFLERIVTQMIHTSYNSPLANSLNHSPANSPSVPRGTLPPANSIDELIQAAAAIHEKFNTGSDKKADWDRLEKALLEVTIRNSQLSTHH